MLLSHQEPIMNAYNSALLNSQQGCNYNVRHVGTIKRVQITKKSAKVHCMAKRKEMFIEIKFMPIPKLQTLLLQLGAD